MKEKTACFSGHRNICGADVPLLTRKLDKTIFALVEKGVLYYGSGASRGFDQLASLAVLRQRERNPNVKLILVLPCRGQELLWCEADKQMYKSLLKAADKVVCLSEQYYDGCMKARNKHLIQHSSVCVAYMTHGRSGTSQTVSMAKKQGLTVINLSTDL